MAGAADKTIYRVWARLRPVLPFVVTAALFAGAAYALYHLLRPVDFKQVMVEIRATPPHIIALSLLATMVGYAALIGYDWSALRYIGKKLPMPVIVTGGFLAYALGNTIGAGPVTGGAIRYRIYSSLGLTGYEITAISVFGSLAFGLGAVIVGSAALVFHPSALESLTSASPYILRWIGIAALVLAGALLVAFATRKSELRFRGHRFDAPSFSLLGGQLLFTAVDILMAAIVLYLLLPPTDLGFATFLAAFAVAILAGVISHVPGGVGVFEAIIIATMPASVPLEQVAAGLLLYRLIYYLVPFTAAVITLSISEFRIASAKQQGRQLQALAPVFRAVVSITPVAMSAMIFASGIFMLISAVLPAPSEIAEDIELLLPLGFVEGGALLSSALGAILIVVAHGMMRRVEGAYWLAIAALAGGVVAALAHELDYGRAIIIALALLVLLPCRREFYRGTRLTRNAFSLSWLLLVASVLAASAAVLMFALKATPYANELWWQFAVDQSAPRAMRAGLVGSLILVILTLILALRPPKFTARLATDDDLERAAAIIATQDNPNANLALTGDKSILFSDSGRAFLMYRIQGRSWIALGDPIGDPGDAAQLAWEFYDAANAANARPVFYEASAENLPLWIEMGLALHKMGEEGVVMLADFGLEGSQRKKLRAAHSRAGRDGFSFEVLGAPLDDATMEILRQISDRWLSDKKSTEKQFSVGQFDPAYLRRFPIAVVRHEGRIVAFANIMTTARGRKATIDLMRHVGDTPSGLMEYLFTELMLYLKAEGFQEFSLGMAPLAGLETRRGSRWTARMGAMVYRHGGHFYNFEGLRSFKDKFDPVWSSRFLVAPPRANVMLIAADAAALIAGGIRSVVAPPRDRASQPEAL